ncbi:MAG: hypothetical protein K5696_00050, partial [Lachnospiraceae bacterium]|nr:hypothetical protein [Lachnospiraceae bacterium]
PYGNYKKVKFYALNNKMLIRTDYKNEFWLVNGPVYAMQFNNFPAEKEYYYAVRAVGKAGNAAGGMDDGVYNCTRPDKVSENEAVAMGLDAASISIAWVHDDCVKQYWIYREDRELVPGENGLVKPTTSPWKKLAANSGVKSVKFEGETYKYNVFKDTKQIIPDRTYYYYIRPVVDVKKAANASEDYNWDLMSDSIPGMASATYTQVKALNPANYSVGSVQLSLSTIKNITNYRIWRAEVAGNVTALTDGMKLAPETLKMEDVIGMTRPSSDGTVQWKFVAQQAPANPSVGGKAMKILDDSVTVGHYYFYLVQTTTDQSAALNYTYSRRIRNIPLAPTNLKASYRNSSKGARVTFQANPRDKDYIGNGALWYYVRWGSHDWVRATQVSGVNFRLDDDTGMSGGERTYIVAAFYGGAPNSGGIKGGEASVKFTKVNRIDLNGSFNLYEGDINEITARAYAGDTAMDGIRIEYDGYDSSVIKVERVDDSNNKFKITAYDGAAGKETNLTFKAGDYSRTVKVRVYAKANKPKK